MLTGWAGGRAREGGARGAEGGGGAVAAGRLVEFVTDHVNAAGEHGVVHDICEAQSTGDMASALTEAMALIEVACDEYIIE